MNSRNLEQTRIFKRYLMKRADRSRLVRNQIWRWVELLDAVQGRERDERRSMNKEITRLMAA